MNRNDHLIWWCTSESGGVLYWWTVSTHSEFFSFSYYNFNLSNCASVLQSSHSNASMYNHFVGCCLLDRHWLTSPLVRGRGAKQITQTVNSFSFDLQEDMEYFMKLCTHQQGLQLSAKFLNWPLAHRRLDEGYSTPLHWYIYTCKCK